MICEHVYRYVNAPICPYCGKDTHETDWQKQHELNKQWKLDNPDSAYGGWWSI